MEFNRDDAKYGTQPPIVGKEIQPCGGYFGANKSVVTTHVLLEPCSNQSVLFEIQKIGSALILVWTPVFQHFTAPLRIVVCHFSQHLKLQCAIQFHWDNPFVGLVGVWKRHSSPAHGLPAFFSSSRLPSGGLRLAGRFFIQPVASMRWVPILKHVHFAGC